MTYTVQPGDTLAGISIRVLGSAAQTQTLFQLNRSQIKSGSPETLTPGERLIIPDQMIAASKASAPSGRDPNDVTLVVNGFEYAGWDSVRISRSLETAAAAFDVSVFDKWKEGEDPWPIFDFDEVRVYIGKDLLVVGYVDDVNLSLDGSSRGMSVSGRARTGDLVDSSATNRPGSFKGKKLEEIAQILAKPFGVNVTCDVDTGDPIPNFALLPGEKVHEAISRAAIARNLVVTSGFDGGLMLMRSGDLRARDGIIEGQNLLSGSAKASSIDRYSDYIVEGQAAGQGKAKNAMRATYHDAGVPRYRPLILPAEQKATVQNLQSRAEWEARARAAKGRSAEATVAGWRQSDGSLWEINRIVGAHSPALGLDDDLLIAETTFDLSPSSGQTVAMRLVRPDAYKSAVELRAGKDAIRQERMQKHGKAHGGLGVSKQDYDDALRDAGSR